MAVAYQQQSHSFLGWDGHPALLIGDDDDRRVEGVARLISEAGLRVAATVPVHAAVERLSLQASARLVWAEFSGEPSDEAIPLLDRLQADAEAQRYSAVVSAPASWLEIVFARAGGPAVEMIIDADEGQRAAGLAIACSKAEFSKALSDVASDNSAVRLRQLSDEVSRIAATLARLSGGAASTPAPTVPPPPAAEAPPVAAETVRTIIRARRMRASHLPADLFADPAWDMLLDLLQAEIVQHRVPVSSLCIAAAVPATTALRWIKSMTDRGLLVRRDDPHDGRRVFIELAPTTSNALRNYFAEVGKLALV